MELTKHRINYISGQLILKFKSRVNFVYSSFKFYSQLSCLFSCHDSSGLVFILLVSLLDSVISVDIIMAKLISSSAIVSFNSNFVSPKS
nr:MAG TPA: hypothetical protein [Bacteriophage sp.]DAR41979.1 MAG TPA: hypothetical protein [Bacteriophage sp.]